MHSNASDGGPSGAVGYDGAQISVPPRAAMAPNQANAVLDALPDCIAVLDQSGTIVFVNEAWRRFGRDNGARPLANDIGANYLMVCRAAQQDEIAQKVLDGLQAILAGTQIGFMLEYACHSPDQRRWFLMRAMPAPGDQPGALVVHSNITARKLAEEEQARLYEAAEAAQRAATQQARRLEALFAAIPDGVVVFDRQGRVSQVNAVDQMLFGSVSGESIEERARRLDLRDADGAPLAPERLPAARALRGDVLTDALAVDAYARTPDGRQIELSGTGGPILDVRGDRAGAVLIYHDVTEQRRAARRYQTTIEMAPDAIVLAGGDGRIQLVNRQTEALFGYPREELLGQPVERLIPERFHSIHRQHRAEYAAAPRTRPMGAGLPLLGRRRDGSEFPIEVSLAPLQADGNLQIIVGIRDVSEVQRVQAANQELRRLLALTDTALAHLELDDLLPELLGRVHEAMGVDNAGILLLSADGQELRVRAAYGLGGEVEVGMRVPVGQGVSGRIAVTREPLIVDDLSTFPVVHTVLRKSVRSMVGVPLLARERVLGVLHVGTVAPHQFTEQDVQLLQRVADRVSVAIERGQMYADVQAAHAAAQQARRDAETALAHVRESEARFHRLVDSGIIGIKVSDGKRVIDANDAFLKMLGYTREDLQAGKLTQEVLAPESEMAAFSERMAREALRTGTCEPFEREYIRRDGSRVPALMGMALLQREPPLFVSFVVDLSERKKLERALLESEQRFRATFEQAAVGMALAAPDGSWLDVNRRLCEMLGYSREELMARTFRDVTHPDDLAADLEYIRQAVAGERDHLEMENRYVRKDGTVGWGQVTAALVRDAAGTPQYFIANVVDATARKQVEERVRWQAGLLDQAHDAMFVWEWGGTITYWNRGAELLYGYSREEAIGQVSHELLRTPHVSIPDFERQLERTGEWTGELLHRTRDGRQVSVLSRHQVVRAPDGRRFVLERSTDITDRKRLEQEREEARARELAARTVADQMDQFFALAAHDIRAPVTAAGGFVQLARMRATQLADLTQAQDGAVANSASRLLDILVEAEASMDRLARMTELLFDIARARADTFTVTPRRCNLCEVVSEQVEAHRMAAPGRTIHLDMPADETISLAADADRLGQVLANFLSNALKYSPHDRPVDVRLERRDGRVRVAVRDRGPGLPPEEQMRVWEMFHRAPGVDVQGEAGAMTASLGLGLHICKRIVEMHPGGRIGVESKVGKGATFWFELPVADEPH